MKSAFEEGIRTPEVEVPPLSPREITVTAWSLHAEDAREAARMARDAGAILLALRGAGSHEGKALGAEGDQRAHRWLMAALRETYPEDAVLSEEGKDDRTRLERRRVWIVDPLDGTREYAEGRDDWAVHVALVCDGALVAGAVALPALKQVLSSCPAPTLGPGQHPPRLVVSRSRPPVEATRVAQALGALTVPMGSAGAKVMAVVRGEAELYVHAGGQYEWDSAAPVAVAAAAGLHVSRLDGSPLRYNQPDVYLPDLVVCRREWADRILAAYMDRALPLDKPPLEGSDPVD